MDSAMRNFPAVEHYISSGRETEVANDKDDDVGQENNGFCNDKPSIKIWISLWITGLNCIYR